MKQIVLGCLTLFLINTVCAQRYDNYWVWGFNPQYQDSIYLGNGDMEFMNDTVDYRPHYRNQAFGITCMSLSDKEGNFCAHSDGMRVLDTTNQIIENGDSVNYGLGWEAFKASQQAGQYSYSVFQGVHFLPQPEHDSVYYLIQLLADANPNFTSWVNSRVCYSKMLVGSNGNLRLTEKNVDISGNFPPNGPGNIASCKHANGRDWWILYNGLDDSCLHKFLLTPDTLIKVGVQCIGNRGSNGSGRKMIFSDDGSKMAKAGIGTGIYDFNRCTGELSNVIIVPNRWEYDSGLGTYVVNLNSIEFSSDNHYLYAVYKKRIYQYDLLSMNVDSIGSLDYFVDTIPFASSGYYTFFQSQKGPDGKIYIGSYSGMRFLSTIDFPNNAVAQCGFGMRDVVLPKFWRLSMPYYPNYRLGRLVGSACDTVYSDVKPIYKETPWLKVYPNPATDNVRLEYNWVEWEKISDCEFRIADLEGRIVLQQKVPRYSTRQEFSVKGLSAGVYTVAITDGEKKIAVCKLTKVE